MSRYLGGGGGGAQVVGEGVGWGWLPRYGGVRSILFFFLTPETKVRDLAGSLIYFVVCVMYTTYSPFLFYLFFIIIIISVAFFFLSQWMFDMEFLLLLGRLFM